MLKLKIGQNYLITDYNKSKDNLKHAVPYMIGCFKGKNLLAFCDSYAILENPDYPYEDVIKIVNEHNTNLLFILHTIDYNAFKSASKPSQKKWLGVMRTLLCSQIQKLKSLKPDLIVKIINVNSFEKTKEFYAGKILYNHLLTDTTSILKYLDVLDNYKYCTQRLNAIPKELEVINGDLTRLSKKKDICDRVVTLKDLDYLKLIKSAEIAKDKLTLHIYPLPIRPSEPLGKVYNEEVFNRNPYLYKAASYIYRGYEFRMPETIIKIDKSFRPEFVETVDHSFDLMFKYHNWSTIGYPHFGQGHLCGGEFNDTMAHAKEYGLDYYFISLKQYLTTANMRDCAGVKIWWYPIYDKDNNIVYCAGYDILIEEGIKSSNPNLYQELKGMTWEEKIRRLEGYDFYNDRVAKYNSGNYSYSYHGPDSFLSKCKKDDIELYTQILKGENK